jgi:hypothetical protein
VTDLTDLNLEFCDGASVSSPTFVLSGSAYGYSVNWVNGKPNGIDFDQAANIILGTSTFTLDWNLSYWSYFY